MVVRRVQAESRTKRHIGTVDTLQVCPPSRSSHSSPRAADIQALAATLASAMADDPMIRWPMPDATPNEQQALFRAILEPYIELGVAWKLPDYSGGAAWLAPAAADRFAEIDESTRPAIYALTRDGGARYATFWDWLGSHLPEEPHWLLDVVAVRPEAQRRGLGRILIQHGLDLARAEGLPAFLETGNQANLPLYESLGFRVVDQQHAPDGGPTIWFMQT